MVDGAIFGNIAVFRRGRIGCDRCLSVCLDDTGLVDHLDIEILLRNGFLGAKSVRS